MLYAVICRDKPGHLQTRLDTRERHVAYLKSTPVVLAGPFLENGEMCGSLVVVEQPDLAGAQAWAAGDPYAAAGLFESVSVTEWKRVIG
ncbi:YciI family protein [Frigidibacter mobilis]|uniref:YCII-related domain-containing protein n=1 Tax=Frigidibacter mobilis TaxID=1335048 RepID=A0A159ZAG8_9RHOB|nr:YciI family protein [Frigidibacter mobilis]AMY71804.1 YCII-related domain-containing protein [Frigidibacter mobilis]